jgi:adenylate cyclase class 2
MSFEVEVKYRVVDHSDLVARLSQHGIASGPAALYEDAYLEHPGRKLSRSNEALRIRRVGQATRITYKGPRWRGPIKAREEIELPIGEGPEVFERTLRLFQNLGFRPVVVVRKTRQPYFLKHLNRSLELSLDVAEGIGTFAEVETITEVESDVPCAQSAVIDVAAKFGLTEIEPRSYRRMVLEHRTKPVGKPHGRVLKIHARHH